MKRIECKLFETCSAPICPMEPEVMGKRVWFPGEEVCESSEYSKEEWIQRQRKFARTISKEAGYFFQDMIARRCIITSATKGIDPDSPLSHAQQREKWFRDHPEMEKREYTEEEKQVLRDRLTKARAAKKST